MQFSKTTISLLFFISVIFLATGFLFLSNTKKDTKKTPHKVDKAKTEKPKEEPKPKLKKSKKYIIQSGDTFEKVAEKLGIEREDMLAMVSSSESVHSLTNLTVGQPLYLLKKADKFIGVEYEINSEHKIITKKSQQNAGFETKKKPIEYRVVTSTIQGTISSSLFKAGKKAGMSDELILDFAEIFAWSVDFAVETKSGDQFKLIYEKRFRNDKQASHGNILAAKVVNQGKHFNAFLFKNKEGEKRYYNKEGESLRRQFLKAPLRYDRISSG
ncbi:MAG: hypothetical protein BRC22_02650, partial [Parcubacteria group bacterium QH_9_35_7]